MLLKIYGFSDHTSTRVATSGIRIKAAIIIGRKRREKPTAQLQEDLELAEQRSRSVKFTSRVGVLEYLRYASRCTPSFVTAAASECDQHAPFFIFPIYKIGYPYNRACSDPSMDLVSSGRIRTLWAYHFLRSLYFYRMLHRLNAGAVSVRINLSKLCAKKEDLRGIIDPQ